VPRACDGVGSELAAPGPSYVVQSLAQRRGFGFDLDGDGVVDNGTGDNAFLPGLYNSLIGPAVAEGATFVIELRGAEVGGGAGCLDVVFWRALRVAGRDGRADVVRLEPGPGPGGPAALGVFRGAVLRHGDLSARGSYLELPVGDAGWLRLHDVRLQAHIDSAGRVELGVIGGRVGARDLLLGLVGESSELFLGMDVRAMLGPADQDLNGDGCREAYSFGLVFEAQRTAVEGRTPTDLPPRAPDEPDCEAIASCSFACVELPDTADRWDCVDACTLRARDPATLRMAHELLVCPLDECGLGTLDAAPERCLAAWYPEPLAACLEGGPGGAESDVCVAGAVECAPGGQRLQCNADGSGWEDGACPEGERCVPGGHCPGMDGAGCQPVVCEPGAARCADEGRAVIACGPLGACWAERPCPAAESCLEGACTATVCESASEWCDPVAQDRLCRCAAEGEPARCDVCLPGEVCSEAECRGDLSCRPASRRCVGYHTRETCAPDGAAWTRNACARGEACRDGLCLPVVCLPHTRGCFDEGAVRLCDVTGTDERIESCDAQEVCLEGACEPAP